jgi:hypothetical protein
MARKLNDIAAIWRMEDQPRQGWREWLAWYRYAILRAMDPSQPFVPPWLQRLHHGGKGGLAAALLEAVSPLAPVGAQLLYMLQPVLGSGDNLSLTASLLEDEERLKATVKALEQGEAEP